jgi:hypothetical protein
MTEQNRLGVEAFFAIENFVKNIQQYNKRLAAAEDATEKYSKRVSKNQTQTSKDTESAVKMQIKSMRDLRWEIITIMFYFRLLSRAAQTVWQTISRGYEDHVQRVASQALASAYEEDLQSVVNSLQRASGQTLSSTDAIEAGLAGLTASQGQFVDQYGALWQAAEVITTVTGEDIIETFQELVQAIAEGDAKAAQSVAPFYDLQGAVEAYARAQGVAVDELSDSERQQVLLNQVLENTQILLENGADEAVAYERSIRQLTGQWRTFTDVLLEAGGGIDAVARLTESLNARLETATQIAAIAGGVFAGLGEVGELIYSNQPLTARGRGLMPFAQLVGTLGGAAQTLQRGGPEAFQEAFMRGFEERFRAAAEAMGVLDERTEDSTQSLQRWSEATEEALLTEDDIGSAIDHIFKYEDIVAKHQERLAEIEERYNRDRLRADRTYRDALIEAENNYQRRREDLISDHDSRLRLLYARRRADRERDLERHLLRLEHAREDYELRVLQSEREYQYERDRLVAEGDVLAIEELDARHALAQRSEEENYQQRVRQMQEMFDLQNQFQRESLDEQVAYLRQKLEEQLREAEEQYEQRVQKARDAYDEDLRQAQEKRQELLDQEAADFQRQREQWAEHWAEIVRETGLAIEQVRQIMAEYFGEGAILDEMMATFMERRAYEVDLINRLLGAVNESVSEAYSNATQAMTATQQLLGFNPLAGPGDAAAGPYLPTIIRQHEGTGFGQSAPPSQGYNLGWQGGPIPIELQATNTATGETQQYEGQLTNIALQQLLRTLSVQLRRAR